jgi:hypothetical protein
MLFSNPSIEGSIYLRILSDASGESFLEKYNWNPYVSIGIITYSLKVKGVIFIVSFSSTQILDLMIIVYSPVQVSHLNLPAPKHVSQLESHLLHSRLSSSL